MDFCNRIKNWCYGFKAVGQPSEVLDSTVHDEAPAVNERDPEDVKINVSATEPEDVKINVSATEPEDVKINVSTTESEEDTEVTEILKPVELTEVAEKLEEVVNELEGLGTKTD